MLRAGPAGELTGWRGFVEVRELLPDGSAGLVLDAFANLITDAGLALLTGALLDGRSARVAWLAVGTGTTAPTPGDTQLGAETARFAVQTPTRLAAGRITTRAYLTDAQAVGQIRELGWFAGDDASSAPGSGVLLARVLYSHAKGDGESLVIDRTDTIVRG